MNRLVLPAIAISLAACAGNLDEPSYESFDDSADAGVTDPEAIELGVQSAALELDPGLIDLDPSVIFDTLYPHKLRIHTCNVADAFTGDPISATVQFGGKGYSFSLKDSDPDKINDWDEFPIYIDYLPQNLDDLQSLLIQKRGINAWCIDQVELYQGDRLRFRFLASDTRSGTYVTPHPAGNLWLDGEGADFAPTSSVLFSELKIPKATASQQRPTVLEIDTCTTAVHPTPGTDDAVSLKFVHDGITEVLDLNNPGNDREPGRTDKYLLDEHGVRNLQSLKLTKSGNDLWCIAAMRLVVGGVTVATRSADTMLDGDVEGLTNSISWTINKVVGGTNVTNSAAFVGLPLKRASLWKPVYPAQLDLRIRNFEGCAPNFDMYIDVTNTGELAADEEVTGTLQATGSYWPVSCFYNDRLTPDCEFVDRQLWSYAGGNSASKRVQLAPGASTTVSFAGIADALYISMPQYMNDVAMTSSASSKTGHDPAGPTKSWQRPDGSLSTQTCL